MTRASVVAVVAALAQSASAANDFNFFDGGGGSNNNWSVAANWNRTDGNTANVQIPDVEPTSNDLVAINNGGTVVINQAGEEAARVRLGQSNQQLTVPGPPVTNTNNSANLGQKGILNILPNGELIDQGAFDLGNYGAGPQAATSGNELNVSGGSLYTGNFLRVAVGAGSGTSTVNLSSGLISVAQQFSTSSGGGQAYIGDAGTGTVNVSGGSLEVLRQIIVGQNTSAVGTLNITGGSVSNGASVPDNNDFVVGNNAAPSAAPNGFVNQTAGSLTSTGRYSIAFLQGASGKVTHSGGTVQVGAFDVGRFGRGDATFSGTAQANVNSLTAVGKYSAGANGTLTVADTAKLTTAGLVVGLEGAGVLNFTGGTINVTGALQGPGYPVPSEGNNELLNLMVGRDGGGAFAGEGLVNHTGGTMNVATNLVLGDFDDSNGVYNISGGTLAVTGNVNVGAALASNAGPTPVGTGGQALNAKGTLHVIGNAATISVGGNFVANPGDRVRTGTANQATLGFDVANGGVSQISVGGVADLDGAVVDMGFVNGSTIVPAFNQSFNLLTAASFGATGVNTTQNTGTGMGFTLAAGDQTDWLLRVVSGGNGQILQAVNRVLPGDTNSDLKVNFADLVTLAQNYNETSGNTRSEGDFNRDGATNFGDLVILAQNYNKDVNGQLVLPDFASAQFKADWALANALVPEPTMMLMLGALAPLAGRRRRRATR